MLLIGLACSRALIVVRASHFTDSNRLHRRIKMQSLDIDQKESTPLAKLTRQCIWINTAFPSLGKRFFSPPFSFLLAADCNPGKSADLGSSFQKHLIKVHHAVSIVKPPGISLWIRGGGGEARLNCLSATETHAFIGNVPSWKRMGLRSWPVRFSKSDRQIGEDENGTASRPRSQEKSEIGGDGYEIVGSGLQKINGPISSLCIHCDDHSVHTHKISSHLWKHETDQRGCHSRRKSILDRHN